MHDKIDALNWVRNQGFRLKPGWISSVKPTDTPFHYVSCTAR